MVSTEVLSNSGPSSPQLSVVVVTVYNSTHLARCLTALEQQVTPPDIETITVCDESIDHIPKLRKRFPSVQFHQAVGRQTEGKLLAIGLRHARGKVVALTVDHCTPEEHWCHRLMKEHRAPWAAIGGAVQKGSQPDTALNWATHFYDDCGYGYYLNPVPRGPASNLSVCNVSYKRKSLTKMADIWADGFHVPAINRALVARGETLWLSPDLLVYQHRGMSFSEALREPYGRGLLFAKGRTSRFTLSKRVLYMVFSPLLPPLLLGRLIMNVLRKRSYLRAFVRALPFTVLLATLWSWGEFVGYLRGGNKHKWPVVDK